MVTCSFCGKELDRKVFCNGSCKTRFHRGDVKPIAVPEFIKKEPLASKKLHDKQMDIVEKISREKLTLKRGELDTDNYT